MIAGEHEQLGPYDVQAQELVGLRSCIQAARIADNLVSSDTMRRAPPNSKHDRLPRFSEAGLTFAFIPKGTGVLLVPVPERAALKGLARGRQSRRLPRPHGSRLMVLVDTSAWIEWLIGSATGEALGPHLPEQADWLVPTIVQLELAKWLTREFGQDKADQVIAFTQLCRVVPLDTGIALAAAEVCRSERLATADAIVFATARAQGARLLICDAHFRDLPGVTLVEKVTG